MTKLDDLEQLAKAATPGPYKACSCSKCGLVWLSNEGTLLTASGHSPGEPDCGDVHTVGVAPGIRNRDFIAAADPQTVLLMIEALRLAAACVKAGVSEPNEGIPTWEIWASNMLRHLNPLQGALYKLE